MKRYLIWSKYGTPWYTATQDKYDPSSHDILFDVVDGLYTINGVYWFPIEEDNP